MPRAALILLFALCSCAGHPSANLGGNLGPSRVVECAPFARSITGFALYGPAADWWREADGRYTRSQVPVRGAVLVFTRSPRLPSGHVSVVSAVVSPREVRLTQANWLHGHIGVNQPALDVSPANDWTQIRVYWPPSGQIGRFVYPAYGFILPPPAMTMAAGD